MGQGKAKKGELLADQDRRGSLEATILAYPAALPSMLPGLITATPLDGPRNATSGILVQ